MDASARALRPDLWFGGSPARVLRLTPAGRSSLLRLRAEGVRDVTGGRLARRLTDAGLAHPVPPAAGAAASSAVTVLVPVLDRPEVLDRCLRALGRAHPVVVVDDGSSDPAAIERVAARHGARLVRREVNGGPGAARNDGLAVIDTEFVALLDSDCAPPPGWIDELLGHLRDPAVAAVAPRVTSAGTGQRGWAARYCRARGGLDLGDRPGRVVPRTRIAYVPTAALVARTHALRSVARGGYVFDPALRYGEDVDLVWRLHDAGWRVRYEPGTGVGHHDPAGLAALLRRRYRYGSSAAPLGRSHPDAVPPLVVHPWATATVVALLAGRPALAVAGFTAAVRSTAEALRTAGVPTDGTTRAMAGAVGQTWLGLGRYLTQVAAPALAVAAAVPGSRVRRAAALSLLAGPSVAAWAPRRSELDAPRFVAAHVADEVAYGLGVWAGCLRTRTLVPLRPVVARAPRRTTAPST
ncbi:MAG: mycofactocin biosynthesis glycosyltransferase MftF [Jatrophihabitans endophyticus]|nr:mycofactocin biosynthesis glycosyltransferase MftF [Jatrophihabitans endophyticus]